MIPGSEKQEITAEDVSISPEDVRLALENILASDAFGRAERPARFLRHLIGRTLEGESRELKESVLGCDVFGRPASWDPRLDPIVRQEAARLRKRITRYYDANEIAPGGVRIELPVGSYVPLFHRAAPAEPPPPAVSPQLTAPAVPPKLALPKSRLFAAASAVILCTVIIGLIVDRSARRDTNVSIAVLPFLNATGDPADQYFSAGLTEEVRDLLSHFKNVHMIARSEILAASKTSSLHNSPQIAKQLHASYLIEGTVERKGDDVNLVASLIRGSDGARLLTNTYRRHSADVTAMEANLAESVGSSLRLSADLSKSQQKHVPPSEAHDYLLKAHYEEGQASVEGNTRAQADFRRAIELDPDYALAYNGLAQAVWNKNIWAGKSPLLAERRKAEELWQKALQIDPDSLAAHSGLAAYAMQYDWDWKRAERELQRAGATGDMVGVEENYAYLCAIQGRRAEAAKHLERARQLDPNGAGRIANRENILELLDRIAEARAECETLVSRNPKAIGPKLSLADLLADQGETNLALETLSSLPQDNPRVQMTLAQVRARAGDRAAVLRLLTPLEENYRDGRMFAYDFAITYAGLGDAPNAVKWMQRSMDAREGPAIYIRADPELAKVQNDPAFRALKKRMGLDW